MSEATEYIVQLIEACRLTGGAVDLRQMPTRGEKPYESKRVYRKLLGEDQVRLSALQRRLFVRGTQGLVVILQGLDASGKDGIIRHVLRAFNPQGCRVYSFGVPNEEERAHDFLWRTTRFLPERGHVSVFNRSHYEEVLVVRVHPEFLARQRIDMSGVEDGSIWAQRFEAISAQEEHLLASGTRAVKLMLHVSAEEQKKRLLSRLSNPEKNWKFDESDFAERKYRPNYLEAYSECLGATSTPESPWYVLPADDKRTARLMAAAILRQTLESMDVSAPEVTPERAAELAKIREQLVGD